MKITFFTLDEAEQEFILKRAKDMGIDPDGLLDFYRDVMKSNFEQDIIDIINENYDFLIQEYSLDNKDK